MIRRYAPIAPSRGTEWPTEVRRAIRARDGGYCVGERAGFPPDVLAKCIRVPVELDHVRASGALGMKSRSTVDNGVELDPFCHRWKTQHGKTARPLLIAYIEGKEPGCTHVDPVFGCCDSRTRGVA